MSTFLSYTCCCFGDNHRYRNPKDNEKHVVEIELNACEALVSLQGNPLVAKLHELKSGHDDKMKMVEEGLDRFVGKVKNDPVLVETDFATEIHAGYQSKIEEFEEKLSGLASMLRRENTE